MGDIQPSKEGFEIHTRRGRVGDRLWKLWKQSRTIAPDEALISETLDATVSHASDEEAWFNAAKALLGL